MGGKHKAREGEGQKEEGENKSQGREGGRGGGMAGRRGGGAEGRAGESAVRGSNRDMAHAAGVAAAPSLPRLADAKTDGGGGRGGGHLLGKSRVNGVEHDGSGRLGRRLGHRRARARRPLLRRCPARTSRRSSQSEKLASWA